MEGLKLAEGGSSRLFTGGEVESDPLLGREECFTLFDSISDEHCSNGASVFAYIVEQDISGWAGSPGEVGGRKRKTSDVRGFDEAPGQDQVRFPCELSPLGLFGLTPEMFSANEACSRFCGAPLPDFMLVSLFSVSKPGALWVARRFLCFSGDTGALFGFNNKSCPRTLGEAGT